MRAVRVPTIPQKVCRVVPIRMKLNHLNVFSMRPVRCTRHMIISSIRLSYKKNCSVKGYVYVGSLSMIMMKVVIHHRVNISTIILMTKRVMSNHRVSILVRVRWRRIRNRRKLPPCWAPMRMNSTNRGRTKLSKVKKSDLAINIRRWANARQSNLHHAPISPNPFRITNDRIPVKCIRRTKNSRYHTHRTC